jgi:hypothetical protein
LVVRRAIAHDRQVRSRRLTLVVVAILASVAAAGLMWRRLSAQAPRARDLGPSPSSTVSAAIPIAAPTVTATATPIVVPDPPLPEHAKLDPRSGEVCPEGMALVDGVYCPAVAHFCEEWVGEDPTAVPGASRPPRRCRRYRDLLVCEGRSSHLHVCVDRYEYPNMVGILPAVMTSYRDALAACAGEGKRLCEADEWSLACEGPSFWPYPNGVVRDPTACNIDRPRRPANLEALARPADVALEVERLDQRTVAGARSGCASPFGLFDMSGNAGEWVHHRHGRRGDLPSDTALAGGDWERKAATCRSLDATHGPDFAGYTTGFRCCSDTKDGVAARRMLPEGQRRAERRRMLR